MKSIAVFCGSAMGNSKILKSRPKLWVSLLRIVESHWFMGVAELV